VEDLYLFYHLLLEGRFVFVEKLLGGYRVLDGSLSHHRLTIAERTCCAIGRLALLYEQFADRCMAAQFREIVVSAQRSYGRYQMGDGNAQLARSVFQRAVWHKVSLNSKVKTLSYLAASCFPEAFQPLWLSPEQQVKRRMESIGLDEEISVSE